MEYENKDICKACGGMCCKKSGCDYFVSDFKTITKAEIMAALETGNVSITSAFRFRTLADGKMISRPLLYLRARNVDRDVIDLFSLKKTCSMLTETGCSYDFEHRPGGGVNLIPDKVKCYPDKNPLQEMLLWEPYQGLLGKMVYRYTGKNVTTVIREDVERVFYELMTDQTDGVDKRELVDVREGLPDLIKCFPEEYKNARTRSGAYLKVYSKSNNKTTK